MTFERHSSACRHKKPTSTSASTHTQLHTHATIHMHEQFMADGDKGGRSGGAYSGRGKQYLIICYRGVCPFGKAEPGKFMHRDLQLAN